MEKLVLNIDDHAKIDRITAIIRFVIKSILIAWFGWLAFLVIISLMCVL